MTSRRGGGTAGRRGLAIPILAAALAVAAAAPGAAEPRRGLTGAAGMAHAYDLVLDADFAALPGALAAACGPAPAEACDTLRAVALAWQATLDPADRAIDAPLAAAAERAIARTEAWSAREPERAEAWFYRGAAYGARVQARVLRGERLAAARDGKRIKEALERALALDPAMHDAEFGLGMYRYYAAVAPAGLRMLRWLLLLPGGDRAGGLEQMRRAGRRGLLVRGEADYQVHVADLWYEQRPDEALALLDSLRARYPRNPLFHEARARLLTTYLHDPIASLGAWEDLRLRAHAHLVHLPDLAWAEASVEAARLLDGLDETDRAVVRLEAVVAAPAAPRSTMDAAAALLPAYRRRLAQPAYHLALDGWRALERGDRRRAVRSLREAARLDPSSAVIRYRLAQALLETGDEAGAAAELERAAGTAAPPVTRARALFDLAGLAARHHDRATAAARYRDASRVFGADRALTARAARLARRF